MQEKRGDVNDLNKLCVSGSIDDLGGTGFDLTTKIVYFACESDLILLPS